MLRSFFMLPVSCPRRGSGGSGSFVFRLAFVFLLVISRNRVLWNSIVGVEGSSLSHFHHMNPIEMYIKGLFILYYRTCSKSQMVLLPRLSSRIMHLFVQSEEKRQITDERDYDRKLVSCPGAWNLGLFHSVQAFFQCARGCKETRYSN